MKKGKFIVIEGVDGSGKTTQVQKLMMYLDKIGIKYIYTREAGGTPQGNDIRNVILNNEYGKDLEPVTQALLFAASYRESLTKLIIPALEAGTWVISDRTNISSVIYQDANNLCPELIQLNDKLCYPDVVAILDVDYRTALSRSKTRARASDHMDRAMQDEDTFNRMLNRYRKYHLDHCNNHFVKSLYAGGTSEQTFNDLMLLIGRELGLKYG